MLAHATDSNKLCRTPSNLALIVDLDKTAGPLPAFLIGFHKSQDIGLGLYT